MSLSRFLRSSLQPFEHLHLSPLQHSFRNRGPLLTFNDNWDEFLNPKVEVIRKDQQTIVQAELAGFNKEDIQINVSEDQRQLVLSGESKRDKTHNEGEISYSEREYGSFTRSFTLPPGSKTEDIKAKFDNGLLEVIIPKGEIKEQQRQITID